MKAIIAHGFLFCLLLSGTGGIADEIVIKSFDHNGVITWDGALLNSTCRVEWASSLTEPGRTNWHCLTNVAVQQPHMSADVPMFYRIVGLAAPSFSEGLVAYYPFDGTCADQSGNGHNGSGNGVTWTEDHAGNANAACLFDGTSSYVEVPDDAQFHMQRLSVAAWLRPSTPLASGSYYVVITKDDWMSGFQLFVYGPGSIWFGVGNGTSWSNLSAPIQPGMWQHVAATYDGTNLSIFVNGSLTASTPCSVAPAYGSNPIQIGRGYWHTQWYNGTADDLRVYNRALSSNEIAQMAGPFVQKWASAASLPSPKADLTVATYNGKAYAIGGYDQTATNALNETYEYNPTGDQWTRKADMPTPRWGPIAVELSGKIYVFGGARDGDVSVDKNEVYNPTADTWQSKTNIPAGLAQQGLMGVAYGTKIHLFYPGAHYEYDPDTDTYAPKAIMPTPRTWGTCAVVSNRIYVIGGFSYADPTGATDVNEVYNPGTDSWTTSAPMPVKKYGVTRESPVINGRIYVTHGLDGGFHVDNYVYDPTSNTWQQKASAVHPRDGVGCAVLGGQLHVIGGRADYAGPYGLVYHEVYDPSADN